MDLRLLAEHFVRLHSLEGHVLTLTPAALSKLSSHSWPGNVRELRSVVRHALMMRRSSLLDAADIVLEPPLDEPWAPKSDPYELPEGLTLEQWGEQFQREVVTRILRRLRFDMDRTAQKLGMGRSTLYKRLKQWGLDRDEEQGPPP